MNTAQLLSAFIVSVVIQNIRCHNATYSNAKSLTKTGNASLRKALENENLVMKILKNEKSDHILKLISDTLQKPNRKTRQSPAPRVATQKPQPFSVSQSRNFESGKMSSGYPRVTPASPFYQSTYSTKIGSTPVPQTDFPVASTGPYDQYYSNQDYNPESNAIGNPNADFNPNENTDFPANPDPVFSAVPNVDPPQNSINAVPDPASPSFENGNLEHPPHIHAIDAECSKENMTINVEFDKVYNGIIYSKGFYSSPECRFISENSGKVKYSFNVKLNSCGTQFVNEFDKGGKAYLENVLVLQNEPAIQEVWDVVRSIRCLWEGNIRQALTAGLGVDSLNNHEVVTFSGDTATAKLDIQIGKGPYAPIANGLVKIGETMTLVVTVDGDPGFDVVVRNCMATDGKENTKNVLQLSDENGCILKPKLFDPFQNIRDPNTGNVISYAYFQAFKFPEAADLYIECNVDLCKANCQPCTTTPGQSKFNRKKRSANYTVIEGSSELLVGKVHVYSPYEFDIHPASLTRDISELENSMPESKLCLSLAAFYMSFSLMITLLLVISFCAAVLWKRLNAVKSKGIYR